MNRTSLLSGATATGAGSSKTLRKAHRTHVLQVTITGGPSSVIVALEGSLNGTNWDSLGSITMSAGQLSAGVGILHVVDKPVYFVRANLTTLSGGTAPTVTVLHASVD